MGQAVPDIVRSGQIKYLVCLGIVVLSTAMSTLTFIKRFLIF